MSGESIQVPEALKVMPRMQLAQRSHEVESDIAKFTAIKQVCVIGSVSGLEGHNDGGSVLAGAVADIKQRYNVDVEPTVAGVEGFLEALSNMATVIKRAISDPKAEQAKIKNALWEVRKAVEVYASPAWIGRQEWTNEGDVLVSTPGFLKDVKDIASLRSVLKQVIDKAVSAQGTYSKNDTARQKAAKAVWNETKDWDPKEKTKADLKPLLDKIPAALPDPKAAAGLDKLDINTSNVRLPVIAKASVKEFTDIMSMVYMATSEMFKNEDRMPEALDWEKYKKNKFLVEVNSNEIYMLISAEGDEPGCSMISSAYCQKMKEVAKFLEMWLLRSSK